MDLCLNSIRILIGLMLLVLLTEGCATNLPTVREISQSTVAASSSFDSIADDLPKSCVRTVEISFMPTPEDKVSIVDNTVEYSTEYQNALSQCDKLRNSVEGIIEVNNVLKGYDEVLGELASDNAVTFKTEINVLQSSFKEININSSNPFIEPKADAVSGLAKFLFNDAINGYRQREIKQTIQMRHKYLPQIIDGLSDVTGHYQATLSDEEKNVVQIQTILILDRKKPEGKRVFKLTNTEIDEKLFRTKKVIEFI